MKDEFRRVTVMTRHGGCEAIDLLFCSVQGGNSVRQQKRNPHTATQLIIALLWWSKPRPATVLAIIAVCTLSPGGARGPQQCRRQNKNEVVSKLGPASERTMHHRDNSKLTLLRDTNWSERSSALARPSL